MLLDVLPDDQRLVIAPGHAAYRGESPDDDYGRYGAQSDEPLDEIDPDQVDEPLEDDELYEPDPQDDEETAQAPWQMGRAAISSATWSCGRHLRAE